MKTGFQFVLSLNFRNCYQTFRLTECHCYIFDFDITKSKAKYAKDEIDFEH